MIKIMHIVESFGGGVFTYLVELCNSLSNEFNVTLVYSIRDQTPDDYSDYFDDNITLIRAKNGQRSINIIRDIKYSKEIKLLIEKVSPDIIHLHSSKAGFAGRMATNCKKYNVIYTPHGYSFLDCSASPIKRMVYRLVERLLGLKSALTIAVSASEYSVAINLTKKVTMIENGINIKRLKYYETKIVNYNEIKIGTHARISYQKNPELFNSIALALPKVAFKWIGDGNLCNYLSSKNIEITGWLGIEDALHQLNECNIFLLTSLWEGLPISLLEAMYLKKICIVNDIPSCREVIEHGINGFVASNIDDFIDIIDSIAKNKYDVEKITDVARNHVLKKYNVQIMSLRYAQQYKRIINLNGDK